MLNHDKIIFVWGRFTAWWYAKNLLLKDLAHRVDVAAAHLASYDISSKQTVFFYSGQSEYCIKFRLSNRDFLFADIKWNEEYVIFIFYIYSEDKWKTDEDALKVQKSYDIT